MGKTQYFRPRTVLQVLLLFSIAFSLLSPALAAQELYWEAPRVIVPSGARFPDADEGGGKSAFLWHEYERQEGKIVGLSISLAVKGSINAEWELYERIIGPVDYTGEEVPLSTLAVTESGEIYIAAALTGQRIDVYRLADGGEARFDLIGSAGRRGGSEVSVAPKLFERKDGGFILSVTKPFAASVSAAVGETLGITYSLSDDGRSWTEFVPLVDSPELSYIYLPSHYRYDGRDFIVFQASPPSSRYFQIYITRSEDGGRSWSSPVRITDFEDRQITEDENPENYDNQRPHLNGRDGRLYLTWERRYIGTTPPQIYYLELDQNGEPAGEAERISTVSSSCRNPKTIVRGDDVYIVWFDDRKGDNRVFLARREGIAWLDQDVSIMPGSSTFPRYFVAEEEIHLVWENTLDDTGRIVLLDPDRTVLPPDIRAVNFRPGSRAKQDSFRISWNIPDDSSGIAGFNYSVDRNPNGSPRKQMRILRQQERLAETEVESDGSWYFHLVARDYAGNWSQPQTVEFIRDTTPPPPITFEEHETNERGFFPGNTASIRWKPDAGEPIAGYSYRLQYLASQWYPGEPEDFQVKVPPGSVQTAREEYSFTNMDNGLWALTVSPVDTVGNVGPPETYYFRLNNYIPVTYITSIDVQKDQLNRYQLGIYGRGFSAGGEIKQVMLDADGEEPYDLVFPAETGIYEVQNDRYIEGPLVQDVSEASYRVGLVHPSRGVYFTGYRLSFEASGTVKFGDFRILGGAEEELVRRETVTLSMGSLAFFILMLFLASLLVFAVLKLSSVVKEGYDLQQEVKAIVNTRALPSEKKKERLRTMKKRRGSLWIKFALLVTFLVLIIVLLVSLPLGRYMIQTQQEDLTNGLQESTRVLIESINSGAQKFLPEENSIELGRLPRQISAAEDAQFVTITGPPSSSIQPQEENRFDYLWASNDPEIGEDLVRNEEGRTNIDDGAQFDRGVSRLEDEISPEAEELKERINREGGQRVGELTKRIGELQDEARTAAQRLVQTQDEDVAQLLTELQNEITRLSAQVDEELEEIGDMMGSYPQFKPEEILTGPGKYVFYRPVVYQETDQEGVYYHGMVRLGISTDRIRSVITESRETLVRQTIIIALGAVGIGIIGALILAGIIIIPIRKLMAGVEKIRDAEDLSKFTERINVKSRDEIAVLAATINEMTDGLVKAEAARRDLIFGKETQKRFIPLEESGKEKLTTGKKVTEKMDFFGYYEGAKGVSGDYFDYIEYAPDRYAFIKCDVAGKGIPASLIMVEVATVFHNYLNDFMENEERRRNLAAAKKKTHTTQDPDIGKLILGINRLVQERGFEGKFAALVVALVNAGTGSTVFCNAGDSLVHIFNREKGRMEMKELKKAPATGVFDNEMVEQTGGFPKEPHMLKRGDAILFYTDGIEEAKRNFRDANFERIVCHEPGLKENEDHGGTHLVGADNEEFTNERIYSIINAAFSRGTYRLYKYHNPFGEEYLDFDFSECEGTIEDAVLSLVSVEKIFRVYPDPSAGDRDYIRVDRAILNFLKKHFLQYQSYFANEVEQEAPGQYAVFARLREDEQYDDLTILGIQRK